MKINLFVFEILEIKLIWNAQWIDALYMPEDWEARDRMVLSLGAALLMAMNVAVRKKERENL